MLHKRLVYMDPTCTRLHEQLWYSNPPLFRYGDLDRRNIYLGGIGKNCATSAAGTACEGGTSLTFTYDGPLVTSAFMYNGGTSGGSTVTISGLNFGYSDSTPESYVGSGISCATTSWTSGTTVNCAPGNPASGGLGVHVAMTRRQDGANAYFGTMLYAFTFDAPTVSYSFQSNVPFTGGSSVTISGLSFAALDSTVTVSIKGVMCSCSSWTSATMLLCSSSPVSSSVHPLHMRSSVTIGEVVGTMSISFSFDAPTLSYSTFNMPTSGGGAVTVYGMNFAPVNYTPTAEVGSMICPSTSWNSATAIQCVAPAGYFFLRKKGLQCGRCLKWLALLALMTAVMNCHII